MKTAMLFYFLLGNMGEHIIDEHIICLEHTGPRADVFLLLDLHNICCNMLLPPFYLSCDHNNFGKFWYKLKTKLKLNNFILV